jgi:arsenate reductase
MDLVLFLSMHDASRGPMAAALFNATADPDRVQARSAGFRPAAHFDHQVVAAMADAGVPMQNQLPRRLTYELLCQASLIVHITSDTPAQVSDREVFWTVPLIRPPTAEGIHAVRRHLQQRIGKLIADRAWGLHSPYANHG